MGMISFGGCGWFNTRTVPPGDHPRHPDFSQTLAKTRK